MPADDRRLVGENAIGTVDLAMKLAGAAALYRKAELERHFRGASSSIPDVIDPDCSARASASAGGEPGVGWSIRATLSLKPLYNVCAGLSLILILGFLGR